MSNNHEIPIGTKLWYGNNQSDVYTVVGYLDDGDLQVKTPTGNTICFFGRGGPATWERIKRYGWYYELPGPKVSNRGFAKFVRRIENV